VRLCSEVRFCEALPLMRSKGKDLPNAYPAGGAREQNQCLKEVRAAALNSPRVSWERPSATVLNYHEDARSERELPPSCCQSRTPSPLPKQSST